jgi:hypothetical protein
MNNFFALALCLLFTYSGSAQQKPASATKPASAKAPVLTIQWTGKPSGNLKVTELQRMVDSPLVAVDEKGIRYNVVGFRINYTFSGSYKDEETGLTKTMKDFRAFEFDNTDRLSDLWKESIRDNAKKDDAILFNKIFVQLKNGKRIMAKDLRYAVTQ